MYRVIFALTGRMVFIFIENREKRTNEKTNKLHKRRHAYIQYVIKK